MVNKQLTDPEQGLTSQQVSARLEQGLHNRAQDRAGRTEGQIIAQKCLTFFNFVFIALAVVLALAGSTVKNMTFLIVVIINAVIGCVQEIRAKRAVDKLSLVAQRPVLTVRDGQTQPIPSEDLVQDDVVIFSPGDQICADAVVCTGALQVNEALVTGEADPVSKVPGEELLSGSYVISGSARARLTRVGDAAFAARLAAQAKADPRAAKSEMMRSLDKLIRFVGIALIPIGLLLFYQEFYALQLGLRASAEATVAALVGMIPEGLYLLTSVAMAASALKLTRQKVLVQDLNCIETLARVDVLCVDKTGTITEPSMSVEDIIPLREQDTQAVRTVLAALFNEVPENDTARALRKKFPLIPDLAVTRRFPFTSERKWGGGELEGLGTFLIGAPEILLQNTHPEAVEQSAQWASLGYRVLLLGKYDGIPENDPDPEKLTPMALILLTNPIRKSAPTTFSYFREQGVTVKVISGDSPVTASEVARRAGIENAEKWVDAAALETEEDFLRASQAFTVFGRVTPDKKRALIRALKAQKHTVAMTGDGVNDVLAMKDANCAIAMAGGAQAASQVAQLVLLNNDFSAMPGIVGEGRRVINNIQRAAALFLVKNIFSLFLALISPLTGWAYPLVPLHLTLISALTIGVPSFFLAMEPNYERVRGRFLTGVLRRAFPGGLTNIFVILAVQAYSDAFGLSADQTSTLCTAVLAVVGLLVLYQVSKPFDLFRGAIWGAMAGALFLCFTVFSGFFGLVPGKLDTVLLAVTLLLATPTVFFVLQRLFDLGDRLVRSRR